MRILNAKKCEYMKEIMAELVRKMCNKAMRK